MQFPREVVVGNGTIDLIGEVCERLNFLESAFMITGPETFHVAGQKAVDLLYNSGLKVNYLIVNSQIPTMKDAVTIEGEIRRYRPEVVLGVGGGTKIDLAKLSSAQSGVPFISIPTTASHDGIASPFASLRGLERPYSIMAQSPMAVIADTKMIIRAPHRSLLSGCADIMAKFTAILDWNLAHDRKNEYFGQYSASLALMSARHVTDNSKLIRPGSEEGLRVVLEALVSCGVAMGIAGTSRPCSGSEHLFSHVLDLIADKPAMHGEQCGLGTIMMAHLHGAEWRDIRNTLRQIGAPTTAAEIGVEPERIIKALVLAREIRPERYTILSEKPLTHRSAEELAKATGVIE